MKKVKHLHIMNNDKFCMPYVKFIEENFGKDDHVFLFLHNYPEKFGEIKKQENIIDLSKKNIILIMLYAMYYMLCSNKLYFHGLLSSKENIFFALNPWIFKKSYWAIWGTDLYEYMNREQNPKWQTKIMYKANDFVKGSMAGYITHIKGDYGLAQKWFGAKGQYYDCFLYLSNLYKDISIKEVEKEDLYIQIGNSADPSNNHKDILDNLLPYKTKNIKIYCPLSYGDERWAKEIKEYGEKLYGSKFIPMMDFLSFDEYCQFNSNIDIAIFAHNRQQAVGNIISLLGMGKTVYLRKTVTTASMLDDLDVAYLDFDKFNSINKISIQQSESNKIRIKEHFSKQKLIEQWGAIFNA